jgi:hypothetical protein
MMPQTRTNHLLALLRDGHPFRIAVILTGHFFNVPVHVIEREFYR